MTKPSDTILSGQPVITTAAAQLSADRRSDIDAKHKLIAGLMRDVGCEHLLVLDQENLAWLTAGAVARGVLDAASLPALLYSTDKRCLLCCNADSQRMFDEELDGLGFELKEWPWHAGRESWLAELCHGRRLACDLPHVAGAVPVTPVGDRLHHLRLALTSYDQVCYRALGQILSRALESTCHTIAQGETEREVAGQVSHRLIRRGAQPVHISVAADGRSRFYRQCGFTALPIQKYCVMTATARKYGLCVTASRSMSFGAAESAFLKEHHAACKVAATYMASTWPDAVPREILSAGRRVYHIVGFEHEWLSGPQGHITGRLPVELTIMPQMAELLQAGWAVTWRVGVGAASSCDTFLVTDEGPKIITPTETWPVKRLRIQGAELGRPDILQR